MFIFVWMSSFITCYIWIFCLYGRHIFLFRFYLYVLYLPHFIITHIFCLPIFIHISTSLVISSNPWSNALGCWVRAFPRDGGGQSRVLSKAQETVNNTINGKVHKLVPSADCLDYWYIEWLLTSEEECQVKVKCSRLRILCLAVGKCALEIW